MSTSNENMAQLLEQSAIGRDESDLLLGGKFLARVAKSSPLSKERIQRVMRDFIQKGKEEQKPQEPDDTKIPCSPSFDDEGDYNEDDSSSHDNPDVPESQSEPEQQEAEKRTNPAEDVEPKKKKPRLQPTRLSETLTTLRQKAAKNKSLLSAIPNKDSRTEKKPRINISAVDSHKTKTGNSVEFHVKMFFSSTPKQDKANTASTSTSITLSSQ
ncbi:hypothetical protein ACFORL_06320 [Legionella dresdenensis]|uniref:Uncharacterized protein n=1 Tax=Legionella dresdenensis TaxID=450200 RepID=A0ABV8CEP9_9GAMM